MGPHPPCVSLVLIYRDKFEIAFIGSDLRSILKVDLIVTCAASKVICIHINTWN